MRTQLSRGELHKKRSLMWTRSGTCCAIGFFCTTLDCDIRACPSFQPWEISPLNARKHSHEYESDRRIVGGAARHSSSNLTIFFDVFERQELLELTPKKTVLDFCSCECVHAFSAEHYAEKADGPRFHSNVVLKITITQHLHLLVHMRFLFLLSSRVGHLRCQK